MTQLHQNRAKLKVNAAGKKDTDTQITIEVNEHGPSCQPAL